MKKVRIFTAVMALLMLIVFVSCAKIPDEENTPPADTTTYSGESKPEETSAPEETDAPNYISDIPEDLNFNNRTIRMLVTGQPFSDDEFATAGINGETVNDAVYSRNMAIEDRIGVKLDIRIAAADSVYNVGNAIRNAVASGDKSYDIATMPGYTHTSYVLEGDFYNLLSVENLDLDKYYWTQGFNGIMNNGTKQYIASGAYSISMYRNMYITLYNKRVMEEQGLEDLYDIVKRGEWTVAKQAEMVKNVYIDKNGDTQKDAEDLYGFVTGANTSTDPYWISLNIPFLQLNDGIYSIDINTDKLTDAVSAVQDLIFNNGGVYCVGTTGSSVDGSNATTIISCFSSGNAAMCTTMIFQIENFLTPNNFADDYGIVPMPKYDEAQQDYFTHVQDQLSVIGVVSTVNEADLPMMGAVLEVLSEESYKTIYPAYYKTALSYKYLQNEQSIEMLDLIYHSIKIEGAFIYSAKFAMLGSLRSIISSNNNRIASTVKGYSKSWGKSAESLNTELEKLKH